MGADWRAESVGKNMLITRNGIIPAQRRLFVSDGFNRPDNASTLGKADTGQSWQALSGTWGITSNTAYLVSGALAHAAIDTGKSDFLYRVSIPVNDQGFGILIRINDINNLYMLQNTSSGYKLFVRISGSYTQLAASGIAGANGDLIEITCAGDRIVTKINGVPVIDLSTHDYFDNTKVGLYNTNANIAVRFDNLSVEEA